MRHPTYTRLPGFMVIRIYYGYFSALVMPGAAICSLALEEDFSEGHQTQSRWNVLFKVIWKFMIFRRVEDASSTLLPDGGTKTFMDEVIADLRYQK